MTTHARWLLVIATIAIGFAAVDTYVVVLALPDMMTSVGLDVAQLQKAAPVISGFLLGYIAILPLIGRLSDIHGRVPVLIFALIVFSLGSFLTATSDGLGSMVIGRFAQGLGGGGLIPPTLALVADLWPAHKRGLPLGIVGAVQELGSVIGPLFGAVVLAFADWRMIFWINVIIGLMLAAALYRLRKSPSMIPNVATMIIAAIFIVSFVLWQLAPPGLLSDVTWGLAWVPLFGSWGSPLAIFTTGTACVLLWRSFHRNRQIWIDTVAAVDLSGALGISIALSAVVILFASAEPETHVISSAWPWMIPLGLAGLIIFAVRQRFSATPIVPQGSLNQRPAWGALVVSFFIGVALISALVDVPIFARLTVAPDSQLDAALVLLKMLIALPIGAILGGYFTRWINPGLLTAAGLLITAGAFIHMAQWNTQSLQQLSSDIALIAAGFGIGITIAPVNSRLLDATAHEHHGLASAFLVVFRMIGMLIGVSALTAIGLRRFYLAEAHIPDLTELCGSAAVCPAYTQAVIEAALTQLRTVFAGAAIAAVIGATLAIGLLAPRLSTTVES